MTNSQVIVPRVILTDSLDVVKLFDDKTLNYKSYLEKINILEKNNDFLFITNENTNIINFEISILGNSAASRGMTTTIEFIASDETFERRILQKDINSAYLERQFYLAFGADNDFINWSQFQSVTLLYSEIFHDFDEPRTIRLNFADPVPIHGLDEKLFEFYSKTAKQIADLIKIYISEDTTLTALPDGSIADKVGLINSENELSQIFRGFTAFDAAFKRLVRKFLRSTFVDGNNVLFVAGDVEAIANTKIPNIAPANEQGVDEIFTDRVLNFTEYIRKPELASTYVSGPKLFKRTRVTSSDLQYKNRINYKFSKLFPSLNFTTKRITDIEILAPSYQEVVESSNNYGATLSINYTSVNRQGETDDAIKDKIKEFLEELERGLSLEPPLDQDSCILIRETDIKIINLFIDYVQSVDSTLVRDFNLIKNKPLIIFGPETVVRALLYGETFENTKITSLNTRSRDYINLFLKQKIKDSYALYGANNNLLTPLQRISDDITQQLNNITNKTDPDQLLIFRHNIVNGNVLSIKVDDYKAYTQYLGIPSFIQDLNETEKENLLSVTEKTLQTFFIENDYFDLDRPESYLSLAEAAKDRRLNDLNNFIITLMKDKSFRTNPIVNQLLELSKTARGLSSKSFQDTYLQFQKLLFILSEQYKEGNGISLVLDQGSDRNVDIQLFSLLSKLQTAKYRVTIKTLPLFFASTRYFLTEPCILLSKRPSLINSNDIFDTVLSGGYIIIGFKHIINKSNMESEFVLLKLTD